LACALPFAALAWLGRCSVPVCPGTPSEGAVALSCAGAAPAAGPLGAREKCVSVRVCVCVRPLEAECHGGSILRGDCFPPSQAPPQVFTRSPQLGALAVRLMCCALARWVAGGALHCASPRVRNCRLRFQKQARDTSGVATVAQRFPCKLGDAWRLGQLQGFRQSRMVARAAGKGSCLRSQGCCLRGARSLAADLRLGQGDLAGPPSSAGAERGERCTPCQRLEQTVVLCSKHGGRWARIGSPGCLGPL
jgi:hypothetical protein